MNNSNTASIIIPTFNGIDLLKKNLPNVIKAQKFDRNIWEIIVVDDASSDGSSKYISDNFPEVKIVRHKVNRGFSAAINTGARSSKGKYLVLLNNDVSPEKDFLIKALPRFKNDNVFGVSFNEGKYLWTKGIFRNGFIVFESGEKLDKVSNTFWVSGGSGVFRRKYWMQLGGLDEVLFSPFYWEDIDLSYRAQKRGWQVLWEPGSKVTHYHESTTGKYPKRYRERIQERNQLLFIWKNLTSSGLFKKHIIGLFERLAKHPGYVVILLMVFGKFRSVLRARKKEKKECKVSDEAIFQKFL